MLTIQQELKQSKPFATRALEAGVSLLRTADLVRRNIAVVIEARGITIQQYNVLRILRGAGERGIPTLDITERLIEETPGITRLLDRLEAKQLVARERCTVDRRRVYCRITPAGLALLEELAAPLSRAESDGLGAMNKKELETLVALLDRARAALHESIDSQRSGNRRSAASPQETRKRRHS